jgi:hypothetical protein
MRERAKSGRVTGIAGALVLALAVVLLILAAPSHPGAGLRGPVGPPAFPVRTVARVIQTPEPATGPAR